MPVLALILLCIYGLRCSYVSRAPLPTADLSQSSQTLVSLSAAGRFQKRFGCPLFFEDPKHPYLSMLPVNLSIFSRLCEVRKTVPLPSIPPDNLLGGNHSTEATIVPFSARSGLDVPTSILDQGCGTSIELQSGFSLMTRRLFRAHSWRPRPHAGR